MISKFPVIDVAGNHDVWAVDSFYSKENKILDYSFNFNRSSVKSEKDFIIKKIEIFTLIYLINSQKYFIQ